MTPRAGISPEGSVRGTSLETGWAVPGSCASACILNYLGADYRYLRSGVSADDDYGNVYDGKPARHHLTVAVDAVFVDARERGKFYAAAMTARLIQILRIEAHWLHLRVDPTESAILVLRLEGEVHNCGGDLVMSSIHCWMLELKHWHDDAADDAAPSMPNFKTVNVAGDFGWR